jgi:hypothetical protein
MTNGVAIQWFGLGLGIGYQINGLHNHARRAKPALQAMTVLKRRLHWMKVIGAADAFDGYHLGTLSLNRQH